MELSRLQIYYQKNKEIVKARAKEWAKNNPDRVRASLQKPERKLKKKLADKRWCSENREKSRQIKARWQKKNASHRALKESQRRDAIKQATPRWADLSLIKKFYLERPPNMSVDHIYPIKSSWCCGLHVIENLQYLPLIDNILKQNKRPACEPKSQAHDVNRGEREIAI